MLYIDGTLLATNNSSKDYQFAKQVAEYKSTIKEIREKFGDYLVIQTKTKAYADKLTGVLRVPSPRGLLVQQNVPDDEAGINEWVYSPSTLRKVDDQLIIPKPNILVMHGSHTIDVRRNPDLAFFVYKKSGQVGKTQEEGKTFHILDEAYINKVEADKNRKIAKVMNLIYNSIPENNLRILAKSFGVQDVDVKDIESVRAMLHQKLQSGEDAKQRNESGHRGFDEFIESADVKEYDQVYALAVDAEEKGKLIFIDTDRAWALDYKDGAEPLLLKELSGDEFSNPMDSLVKYLLDNREALRKLQLIMGNPDPKPQTELTLESVSAETNYLKLKKIAKDNFPDIVIEKGMTVEQVKGEIVRRLMTQTAV